MWNIKAGSKITQDRVKRQSYDIHREKLRKMKSMIKIKQPYQPQFVFAKFKLQLSRRGTLADNEDRRTQIDKHNQILLRKMNQIKLAEYDTNKLRSQAQNLTTLNQHIMNQMTQQITKQNKRMCEKLLKTNSFYPTNKILTNTQQLERVCSNISENARRCQSAKRLQSARSTLRPKSGYTTISSSKKRDTYRSKNSIYGQRYYKQAPEDIRLKIQSQTLPYSRPQSAPTFKRLKKILNKED